MKKSNLPSSNQNQATILETWGYYKKSSSDSKEEKALNCKLFNFEKKQGFSEKCDNNQVFADSSAFPHADVFSGLLTDDNDLIEAVETAEQDVYLDTKFKPDHCREDIPGFDEAFGSTYVYPTNYAIRDYQFNIVRKALLENTLVVLPTGLGKTFIASVVMYNFYRWYPQGKLIFMAPTKPLVAQQIEACYKIMGIPQVDTVEMTGAMAPTKRELLWKTKRVFFLTPQVLQNDLGRGTCFAPDVVCLVFDEAHRALGNHAYCQVIKEILRYRSNFRVLALSATPGGDMKAVQQVISNLLISHVEVRTEESIDICKYVHHRNIEKIIVPMSLQLNKTKAIFLEVLRIAIKRLHSRKVLWQEEPEKMSKFQLLKAREQWRASNPISDRQMAGVIEGDFGLCMSLYHAYELLQQHGLLSFYNFLKGILGGVKGTPRCRTELSQNAAFMTMMEELHCEIEPEDGNQSLNQSILIEKNMTPKQRLLKSIPKPLNNFSSHPKLLKLQEIVVEHFKRYCPNNLKNTSIQTPLNTRVMVFSQYRDSVQEITALLSKHEPLIKVMSFIGQGNKETSGGKNTKGLSQKEQFEVLQKFRNGGYNTIVSTSVGEEGLDIGDVDLIVCFDASSSPIRLVQRMGRTGRIRDGRIVILIGEGKEETIYKRCLSSKKGIHKNLLTAAKALNLYDENHRMIPRHLNPKCYKMNVSVEHFKQKNNNKRSVSKKSSVPLKKRFNGKSLNADEVKHLKEQFYGNAESCVRCKNLQSASCHHLFYKPLSTSAWLPWQATPQTVSNVTHSKRSNMLCTLMQFANECRNNDFLENYVTKTKKSFKQVDIINDKISYKENNFILKDQNLVQYRKNNTLDVSETDNDIPSTDDDDFEKKNVKLKLLSLKKNKEIICVDEMLIRDANNSAKKDDRFKPCPMEELLKSNEQILKTKKNKKINLLKLPKVEVNKAGFENVKDNQLDFCSQVTMPTLYNRCKQKQNASDLLKEDVKIKEDIKIKEDMNNITLENKEKLIIEKMKSPELEPFNSIISNECDEEISSSFSSSMPSTLPLSPTWIDHVKSFETTNKHEAMIVKDLIPDAPDDLNFDSLDSSEKTASIDQHFISPIAMSNTNVKKKVEESSLVIMDSLINYIDDIEDEMCLSPPMISNTKKINKEDNCSNITLNDAHAFKSIGKEGDSSQAISRKEQHSPLNDNYAEIFAKSANKSTLFKKTLKKRRVLEISNYSEDLQAFNTESKVDLQAFNSESKLDLVDLASLVSPHMKFNKKVEQVQPVRKKSRLNSMKSNQIKRYKNEYIEYEAEDDEGTILEKESFMDHYIQDSFIDDEVQDSPVKKKKQSGKLDQSLVDMDMVYKRSLLSPSVGDSFLKFSTPAFLVGANRFKLANLKGLSNYDSDQSSEADEVQGLVKLDKNCSDKEEFEGDEEVEEINHQQSTKLKRKKRCFNFLDSDDDVEEKQSIIDCNGELKTNEQQKGSFKCPVDLQQPLKRTLISDYNVKNQSKDSRGNCRLISEHDLPTMVTFSFGIDWHDSIDSKCTNSKTLDEVIKTENVDKCFQNCIDTAPYILVSSRCIANSQIPSLLRSKEKCCVVIKSQLQADFIVSRRMSVNKKMLSEISGAANVSDLYESTQCVLFEKQLLIVEKDVIKTTSRNKCIGYTKTFANLLSKFVGCGIKVLFSSSQEETSSLLSALVKLEAQSGYAICVPKNRDKMIKALLCIPKVTYPLSTEVANQFRCIADLSKCSLESLKKVLSHLPGHLIEDIYLFFKQQFDIGMLGSKKLL